MDWLSNILLLNRKMSMPFSFRTFEEWKKLFEDINYNIFISQYIGFPEQFFHQGPYCLFVLENKR